MGSRFLAFSKVASRGRVPDIVILDGASDWLSAPEPDPTAASDERAQAASTGRPDAAASTPPVRTEVKADARCAVVAAASVLAKVERDALMAALPDPGYDWAANKGYAAPAHVQALRALGACESRVVETPKVQTLNTAYQGQKIAVSIGRFSNQSSYQNGVFSDGEDRLGNQAQTILISNLQQKRTLFGA